MMRIKGLNEKCMEEVHVISLKNKKLRRENEDLLIQVAEIAVLREKLSYEEDQIRSLQKHLSEDLNLQQQQKQNEKKYKKDIHHLKSELEHVTKELNSLRKSAVSGNGVSQAEIVGVISRLESEISGLRYELQSTEQELRDASATIQEMIRQKEDLEEAKLTASNACDAQHSALQKSLERLNEMNRTLDSLREENSQLKSRIADLELSLANHTTLVALVGDEASLNKSSPHKSPNAMDEALVLDLDASAGSAKEEELAASPLSVKKVSTDPLQFDYSTLFLKRRRSIPRFFKFGKSISSGRSILKDEAPPVGKIYWHKGHDHHRKSSRPPSRRVMGQSLPLSLVDEQVRAAAAKHKSPRRGGGGGGGFPSLAEGEEPPPSSASAVEEPKPVVEGREGEKPTPKLLSVSKKGKFVPPADKVVHLLPPAEDANAVELMLRDLLLKALSSYPEMSQNGVHRAMNAMAPLISRLSHLFCQSLQAS
jgi:hypothetical protein